MSGIFTTGGANRPPLQIPVTAGAPGTTNYAVAANVDPLWDAFVARYKRDRGQAEDTSKLQRAKADVDYQQALKLIEQSGLTGSRNIDNNLLARGVFNSGELGARRDELGIKLGNARTVSDNAYTNQVGNIDNTRNGVWGTLDSEWEAQAAASRERIAQKERDDAEMLAKQMENAAGASGGGGSGGGGGGSSGGGGGGVSGQLRSTPPTNPAPAPQTAAERSAAWTQPGRSAVSQLILAPMAAYQATQPRPAAPPPAQTPATQGQGPIVPGSSYQSSEVARKILVPMAAYNMNKPKPKPRALPVVVRR